MSEKQDIKVKALLFAAAVLLAAGLFYGMKKGIIKGSEELNVLVLGIDTRLGWEARSDSINLVRIDFSGRRIGILAIPRDTYTEIPGYGRDKINHAHMFGGPELSCKAVSNLLGIHVDRYIEVNFPLFMNIVDSLGGVTMDVEKPLYYQDYAGDLHVNLKKGVQRLSGYQAMGYVRFRHDRASDWGRIERQHRFFQAVASELSRPSAIIRYPSILYSATSNMRTNLDVSQIVKIGMRVPGIYKTGKVDLGFVPGVDARLGAGYYMLPDEKKMKEEVKRVIFGK